MKKKSVTIRNMLIRGLVPLALLSSSHANAQFMADPLTNAQIVGFQPWVGVGTHVPLISGGTLDLSHSNTYSGVCNYVYRLLRDNTTNNAFSFQSSDTWTAEFGFIPSLGTGSLTPDHTLISLTSSSENSWDICSSGTAYTSSPLDAVEVYYQSPSPTGASSTWGLYARAKRQGIWGTPSIPILINPSSPMPNGGYYIQLQRLSPGVGQLSVYLDNTYTTLLATQCFSMDQNIGNLQYVESGIIPEGGPGRGLNAFIQNLNIWNNAMCNFDYGSDWVQTGSTVYTTATSYTFNNCVDDADDRIDKNIGGLISTSQDWTASAHFNITNVSTDPVYGPGHNILALSAGSANNVLPLTGTSYDMVLAELYGTGTSYAIYGGSRRGNNNFSTSAPGIPVTKNTDYYIVLQRLCSTAGQISVYLDAAHTNVVGTQTFSIDPALTGLNDIQIGSAQWGNGTRELSGEVDNICIKNAWHDGGTIASSQTLCAGVAVPTITGTLPTLGACGTISYFWEQEIGNSGNWTVIPGATSYSYNPGPLSTTTSFIRYSSSFPGSCVNWWSNVVTYTVQNIVPNFAISSSLPLAPNDHFYTIEASNYTYFSQTAVPGFKVKWGVMEVAIGSAGPNYTAIAPGTSEVDDCSSWDNLSGAPVYFDGYVTTLLPFGSNSYNSYGPVGYVLATTSTTQGQFRANHEYCVTLTTSSNACPAKAVSLTVSTGCPACRTEGIESQGVNSQPALKVYPNPSNGTFSIESANYASGTPVEISDMMGRTIWSQTFTDLKHQNIDMSGFENGIYFIKIQGASNYSIQKIIKE